jgi:hypothetical protein
MKFAFHNKRGILFLQEGSSNVIVLIFERKDGFWENTRKMLDVKTNGHSQVNGEFFAIYS